MSKPNTLDLVSNLNLEAERKFAAQTNRSTRVKIEKGHAWLVRFLPFPQGPQRTPFARYAQHWISGRPFECKRHTSPDFGGDPDAICPVCDISEQMHNEATDKADQDLFYKVQARISYRSYCLVFCKEKEGGDAQNSTDEEMLTAHEFNIPKTSFAQLAAKLERSKSRKGGSSAGLLDLETGTDLWAIRDVKNSLTFDISQDGPGPIFTQDDNYDAKLQRVWKQLKQPSFRFLPEDRLNTIADMIAEKTIEKAAKSLDFKNEDSHNSGNGRGASRGRSYEAEDETPVRGRGRRTVESNDAGEEAPRGVSRSNGFSRAQAALADPADDQIPGAEVPNEPQQEEAPPARVTSRRAAPVPVAETAETDLRETTAVTDGEPAQEQAQEETPPPVSTRRQSTGATAKPAPTRIAVPPAVAAGRRVGAAPPPPAAKTGGARIEEETAAEEPPEEQRDPVPPADPEQTDAPARAAAPVRGALQGQLRQTVANLTRSGR